MRPEWFSASPQSDFDPAELQVPGIPFSKMWETDEIWLPLLIAGKKFAGRADFTQQGDTFKPYKWWYGVHSNE